MSVLTVILVRIFPHLNWIQRDVSFRIQSRIRTRITPNTDTFHVVKYTPKESFYLLLEYNTHKNKIFVWAELVLIRYRQKRRSSRVVLKKTCPGTLIYIQRKWNLNKKKIELNICKMFFISIFNELYSFA